MPQKARGQNKLIKNKFIIFINKNLISILFILILILALFLRLYNVPERFNLSGDSLRDALVAIGGAKEWQLPLTGPFSSTGPFTFGPWYYYQLILFTELFQFRYAPWITMVILSTAFIIVMYKIGQALENKTFGLILALLAAISSTQFDAVLSLSNVNQVSLFAAISLWISIKLFNKRLNMWWSFWLGISLGMGINYHYQAAGLLVLPLLLFIYKSFRKEIYIRPSLMTFGGIFVTFIPLLFFNLINHWYTVRGILLSAFYLKNSIYVANSWTIYLRDFWPELISDTLGVPVIIAVILTILSIIIFTVISFRRKLKLTYLFLFSAIFINFMLLRYYWGERHIAYFTYLYPFIYIFIGYVFYYFTKFRTGRFISGFLLITFIILALMNGIHHLQPSTINAQNSRLASTLEKKFQQKNIILYQCKNALFDQRAKITAFLLSDRKQTINDNVKVGFVQFRCPYPIPAVEQSQLIKTKNWEKVFYPPIADLKNVVDFSSASDSALAEAGWVIASPVSEYNEVARWWLSEQP